MAIRNIVKEGDPILRTVCRPVENFDKKLAQLLDDMKETLEKAGGVGLAAPQVGIRKRIFIMMIDEDYLELINPEIVETSGKQRMVEGCLSCPDKWGYVTRPENVKVRARNRKGEVLEYEFTGLAAECACHENDHLDGKLFVDIVEEYVRPEEMKE
jgi:peptide deformylase